MPDMIAELAENNQELAARLREAHNVCDEHRDVATASLIEVWIDETERRTLALGDKARQTANSGTTRCHTSQLEKKTELTSTSIIKTGAARAADITMKTTQSSRVSRRRRFLASVAVATAGVWLMPRRLLAEVESPVVVIRRAAAIAKINVRKLRGNVSVLEGSGGNIACSTRPRQENFLLMPASLLRESRIMRKLSGESEQRSGKHLINTHWRSRWHR